MGIFKVEFNYSTFLYFKRGDKMSNNGVISLSYVVNNSQFNSKMADMKKNLQLLQTECRNAAI